MTDIELIKSHQNRYPHMTIQDHVKRIHQSVFGPAHLHGTPNLETLNHYIDRELSGLSRMLVSKEPEPIGNGFYRVYLDSSLLDTEKKAALVAAFHQSMLLDLGSQTVKYSLIDTNLYILLNWIRTEPTPFIYEDAKLWITAYKEVLYPAIHHSDAYNQLYQPHYRVIHESFLNTL